MPPTSKPPKHKRDVLFPLFAGALIGAAATRYYDTQVETTVPETVSVVVIEDERGVVGWE